MGEEAYSRHDHFIPDGRAYSYNICDRTWEKGPLRAQYDFSVQAFLVYLT